MKQKSFSTVCSLIQAELGSQKSILFCLTFRTRTSFVFIQLFEAKFSISAKQQTSQHIFLPTLLAVWSLDVLTEPTNLLLSLIWVLETEDVLRQSSDSSVNLTMSFNPQTQTNGSEHKRLIGFVVLMILTWRNKNTQTDEIKWFDIWTWGEVWTITTSFCCFTSKSVMYLLCFGMKLKENGGRWSSVTSNNSSSKRFPSFTFLSVDARQRRSWRRNAHVLSCEAENHSNVRSGRRILCSNFTSAEISQALVWLYWFWAFSYRFREFRCLVSSQVQVLLNNISWSFVSVELRRRIVLFHPSLVLCSVLFDHVCLQGALQLSVSDPEKTLLSVLYNTNTITANWMWSEEELREN